jgi:replicative DNA helicase
LAQRAPVEPIRPNRIPPHNLDAELSVLGAMLESKEAIANVLEVIQPGDFYKPAHTEIYEAILALYGRGEGVDAITVAEELKRRGSLDSIGGKPYIHGLLEAYPTASSAGHYARIVEDHSLLRQLVDAGTQVQEIGFSIPEDIPEAIDRAEELVYEVGNRRLRDDIQPIRKLLTENMVAIEQLYERGETIIGLASGFPDLDNLTAGFQPSNLIIVAARPSMGKSALMADFALSAAVRQGAPAVIFSLEMSRHEMVQRFLSSEAKVDSQRLRRGTLQEQDWTRLSAALGRLAEAPVFIDDSANVTLMEIRAKCRRLKAKHGLGLILIDYLQLMQSPRRSENRQQEVSEISRSLKILARELEVPVVCASQLNRAVEYRADKRPLLGDLRESGCLTGDTMIALASGEIVPLISLVGTTPDVATADGWSISTARASKVWCTGRKPIFRLRTATGRVVRATGNHPFRVFDGWRRLEELDVGDRVALARTYPVDPFPSEWPIEKLVLLAHLIGDGSFLRNLPLRYATQSPENVLAVAAAAQIFGVRARVKWEEAARSYQVFLPSPHQCTHGRRNPIVEWIDSLGLFDKRSHEKFLPAEVFALSNAQLALFLRHLWATDGCVWLRTHQRGPKAVVYYATSSRRLADDVQHALARLGIASRIRTTQKGGYRPNFHVHVTGAVDQLRFGVVVGGFGDRGPKVDKMIEILGSVVPRPNVDSIPLEVWDKVRSTMRARGISQRTMQRMRGVTYGGSSHFRFAPTPAQLQNYAELLDDAELKEIAAADLYWDKVVAIEPDGIEEVYDMTVPGTHKFVANGFVLHNSIEQDSDVVMFIYRDEVYNPETEHRGEAEVIVAKHRNGPTGLVRLAFMNQYTKFASIARAPGR